MDEVILFKDGNSTIDNSTISMFDMVSNTVNLGVATFGNIIQFFFCLILFVVVLSKIKSQFNALWISRIFMIFSVILLNIGMVFGNPSSYDWIISLIKGDNSLTIVLDKMYQWFCSSYFVVVFGSEVLLTSLLSWTFFINYKFEKSGLLFQDKPYKLKSLCCSNFLVIALSLFFTFLITAINIATIGVDHLFDNLEYSDFQWLVSSYDNQTCRIPVTSGIAYGVYLLLFFGFFIIAKLKTLNKTISLQFRRKLIINLLIVIFLISISFIVRLIEVLSNNLFSFYYLNKIMFSIVNILDIFNAYIILILYVLLPVWETIDTSNWAKKAHSKMDPFGYGNYNVRKRSRLESFIGEDSKNKRPIQNSEEQNQEEIELENIIEDKTLKDKEKSKINSKDNSANPSSPDENENENGNDSSGQNDDVSLDEIEIDLTESDVL